MSGIITRMKILRSRPRYLLFRLSLDGFPGSSWFGLKSDICPPNYYGVKLFPESAAVQLEFDKVKTLLANYCQSDHARTKAMNLRIHTRKEFIDVELKQSHEYR